MIPEWHRGYSNQLNSYFCDHMIKFSANLRTPTKIYPIMTFVV